MNSAWAMLVRPMAVKKIVMLSPNARPAGKTARHVAALGAGRPVRALRTSTTRDHRTTAISIRQNANTDPGTSAHLMIVELLENARTAATIATMPIGATALRRSRRDVVMVAVTAWPAPGRRPAR